VRFEVVIEQDETGMFIANVPALPGCHTQGATKQEALANVKEAIALYLEAEGRPPRGGRFVSVETVEVQA